MAIELADKLYTSTQVADILGVSLRTLYRYMEDNKIKSMRTASGRHRFTKDHIVEFLNAGRLDTNDAPMNTQGYPMSQNVNQYGQPGNFPQNQRLNQGFQRNPYSDNAQMPQTNMPNPFMPATNFSGVNQPVQPGSNMYGQDNNPPSATVPAESERPIQSNRYEAPAAAPAFDDTDDFEFDVTNYDYDSDITPKPQSEFGNRQSDVIGTKNESDLGNDFKPAQNYSQNRYEAPEPQIERVQRPVETPAPMGRPAYAQSPFAASVGTSVREDSQPEAVDLGSSLNIRYYRSDYSDLIELAKKIKDTANVKDLEYAFTLHAGLSLHFPIKPFTVLNFYANPEDMQLWKDELRLVPSQKRDEANAGIIINTDIVFVPTKEIGGFKVVEDKILLKDLSSVREEDLVKQFRHHLTSI